MKKIITCVMTAILTLTIMSVKSFASTKENPSALVTGKANETIAVTAKPNETTAESAEAAEAKTLLLRLDEIKAMDKTKMNASEKKSLRKEVRSIKRELKNISGGVYISAGALIVILILLILLT